MDINDLLEYNFSNIQQLIRFIDQKAGALLVVYGFLFTAYTECAKNLTFINPFSLGNTLKITFSIAELIDGVLLVVLLIYQIFVVLFRIIKPRSAKNYTQEEDSIIYFEHISNKSRTEYIQHLQKLSEGNLEEIIQKELAAQIYENSRILSEKSKHFNSVLKYLFASIFLLLIFIFLISFV